MILLMNKKVFELAFASALSVYAANIAAEENVELDEYVVQDEVEDEFAILPSESSSGVFGFDKTLAETPRSVTQVSSDLIENYSLRSVDDLVRLTPGAFTSSFFGIQGAMDIRGEPADNYYMGFRRIANPGAFKTNIRGASNLEITRGPVSPLYGTGSVGGQLNFTPKSAKSDTTKYIEEPTGRVDVTLGSYSQKILAAEGGMPFSIGDKQGGIYGFAEVEDSDSFFDDYHPKGSIWQLAVDMDLAEATTMSFSAQYQHDERIQVPGWNRVTQELIDNGTYITGAPPVRNSDNPIGDNRLLPQESGFITTAAPASINGSFSGVGTFCFPSDSGPYTYNGQSVGCTGAPFYAISDAGTAKIDHDTTFIDSLDYAESDAVTLYLDFITDLDNEMVWKNQFFYDYLQHEKYQSWGFTAKYDDMQVFEYRSSLEFPYEISESVTTNNIIGANYRRYESDASHAFFDETFDFRDITVGPTPDDRIDNAVDDPFLSDGTLRRNYNLAEVSTSNNYGLFYLTDIKADKLNVMAGIRYDYFDVESEDQALDLNRRLFIDADGDGEVDHVKGNDGATSFNISTSYATDIGLIPYVTYAESSSLSTNQAGGIIPGTVSSGEFLQDSELKEIGLKYNSDTIYAALSYYDQEKSYRDSQNNQLIAVYSEGYEFEIRALLTENFSITGTATHSDVTEVGNSFAVINGADFAAQNGLNPEDVYGGRIAGDRNTFSGENVELERGGLPDNVVSLYGTYFRPMGAGKFTASLGVTWVDETYMDWAQTVLLPSYDVWTSSLGYRDDKYEILLSINNLFDEEYYTSADLFESVVVKPSEGRTAALMMTYKF